MTDPDATDRRSFLRASAGSAAALAGLAAAGCVELLPPLGQRVNFGRVDVPSPREFEYRSWLPADEAIEGEQYTLYPNVVATPNRDGSEQLGAPIGIGRGFVSGFVDHFGIGLEHYDLAIWFGPAVALEGPVDPDAVEQAVLDSGYDSAGTYDGHELYSRDDRPRTAAVADGQIVWATGDDHDELVRTLLDARAGRIERRHEADPAFDEVSERAGCRPFLMLGRSSPTNFGSRPTAASVSGFDVDEDAVYFLNYLHYEEGVDVSAAELRDDLEGEFFTDTSSAVDVSVDSDVALIQTRITHEAFLADQGGTESYPPQVTWGVEAESDRIVVTHEAGDAVRVERLEFVTTTGQSMPAQISDGVEVLTRGSTFTVNRSDLEVDDSGFQSQSSSRSFRLFWNSPDGATKTVLLDYEIE